MADKTTNFAIEVLMKRLRENDRKAMADLYEISSANLYAIIFRIIKDETEASNILRQVYLHIWNTRHDNKAGDMSVHDHMRATAHRFAIDSYLQKRMHRLFRSCPITAEATQPILTFYPRPIQTRYPFRNSQVSLNNSLKTL